MRGGHSDVREDGLGAVLVDSGEEAVEIRCRRDEVDRFDGAEEGSGPLPNEVVVLGEDDSNGHGAMLHARKERWVTWTKGAPR